MADDVKTGGIAAAPAPADAIVDPAPTNVVAMTQPAAAAPKEHAPAVMVGDAKLRLINAGTADECWQTNSRNRGELAGADGVTMKDGEMLFDGLPISWCANA